MVDTFNQQDKPDFSWRTKARKEEWDQKAHPQPSFQNQKSKIKNPMLIPTLRASFRRGR
jgi:hypothetical protein